MKILILDFDLTLTDIHTGGMIDYNKLYWKSATNLNLLVKTLTRFKSDKWLIYIVSRGIESDIKKYLEKMSINHIFDDVYGAIDYNHLSESTHKWAEYKVRYINKIKNLNNAKHDDICYIDDTVENISQAIDSGYLNSILLLKEKEESSVALVDILDQLICLKPIEYGTETINSKSCPKKNEPTKLFVNINELYYYIKYIDPNPKNTLSSIIEGRDWNLDDLYSVLVGISNAPVEIAILQLQRARIRMEWFGINRDLLVNNYEIVKNIKNTKDEAQRLRRIAKDNKQCMIQ